MIVLLLAFALFAVEGRRKIGEKRKVDHSTSVTDYLKPPTPKKFSSQLLLRENLKSEEILRNHHYYETGCKIKYGGEVLAYVTPWNRKGYDMSRLIAGKLSWIVPVWFQIRFKVASVLADLDNYIIKKIFEWLIGIGGNARCKHHILDGITATSQKASTRMR